MRVTLVAADRNARDEAALWAYQKKTINTITILTNAIRFNYITDIPGQQMLYYRKFDQAREYLATPPQPVIPGTYGLLVAEVGITGADVYQVAQVILNAANAWEAIAVVLEPARRVRMNEVVDAYFIEDCDIALAAFIVDIAGL